MQTKDLKKAGLKITHPRKRILNVLEDTNAKHMTADDIYAFILFLRSLAFLSFQLLGLSDRRIFFYGLETGGV